MKINESHWLLNQPIAHRGLWNENFPENTLSAYKNAVENGYAIEIDIYLTTDNEIVCFHDKTLTRLLGTDGLIYEQSYEHLKTLSVLGSGEKVPLLTELLDCVDGKVPLLIEVKEQPQNKLLIKKFIEIIKNYKGEFAVQSFNPGYVRQFMLQAPNIVRGILATQVVEENCTKFRSWVAKNMPLNFICKPDFISYNHTGLPLPKKLIKNKPLICWTITDQQQADRAYNYAKNVIFENFIPKK